MLLISLLLLAATVSPTPDVPEPTVTAFQTGPSELPAWDAWEVRLVGEFTILTKKKAENSSRLLDALIAEGLCKPAPEPCGVNLHMEARSLRGTDQKVQQTILRYTATNVDGKQMEGVSWVIREGAQNVTRPPDGYYWKYRADGWVESLAANTEMAAEYELYNELVDLARTAGIIIPKPAPKRHIVSPQRIT